MNSIIVQASSPPLRNDPETEPSAPSPPNDSSSSSSSSSLPQTSFITTTTSSSPIIGRTYPSYYQIKKCILIILCLLILNDSMEYFVVTHDYAYSKSKLYIDVGLMLTFVIQSALIYGIIFDSLFAVSVIGIFLAFSIFRITFRAWDGDIPWSLVIIAWLLEAITVSFAIDIYHFRRRRSNSSTILGNKTIRCNLSGQDFSHEPTVAVQATTNTVSNGNRQRFVIQSDRFNPYHRQFDVPDQV